MEENIITHIQNTCHWK